MKVYLELSTDPDEVAKLETLDRAQRIANQLQVTVQLTNGNYGSFIFEPKEE